MPIQNESATLSNKLLFKIAKKNKYKTEIANNLDQALKLVSSNESKIICIFGSLYLCGNVLNKNAFELMPFENSLVVVQLSGDKVKELIRYFIKNKRAHPLSKNVELVINADDSYQLKINNIPFDATKNYFVLTSDYLQSGGDKMDFFKKPISLFKTDYKMRHAIMDEFKSLDTLKTSLDNRVKLN